MRPVGLGGSKKLQDLFVDAKVPRAERSTWLILEVGGAVLWVPGLARSEQATVTSATRRVLVVEARRGPGWRSGRYTAALHRVAAENPICYRASWRRIEPSF